MIMGVNITPLFFKATPLPIASYNGQPSWPLNEVPRVLCMGRSWSKGLQTLNLRPSPLCLNVAQESRKSLGSMLDVHTSAILIHLLKTCLHLFSVLSQNCVSRVFFQWLQLLTLKGDLNYLPSSLNYISQHQNSLSLCQVSIDAFYYKLH